MAPKSHEESKNMNIWTQKMVLDGGMGTLINKVNEKSKTHR